MPLVVTYYCNSNFVQNCKCDEPSSQEYVSVSVLTMAEEEIRSEIGNEEEDGHSPSSKYDEIHNNSEYDKQKLSPINENNAKLDPSGLPTITSSISGSDGEKSKQKGKASKEYRPSDGEVRVSSSSDEGEKEEKSQVKNKGSSRSRPRARARRPVPKIKASLTEVSDNQCKRMGTGWYTGTSWRCPEEILHGERYCKKHFMQAENQNKRRRKKVVGDSSCLKDYKIHNNGGAEEGISEYEKQRRLSQITENKAESESLELPTLVSSILDSVKEQCKRKGKAKDKDDEYRPSHGEDKVSSSTEGDKKEEEFQVQNMGSSRACGRTSIPKIEPSIIKVSDNQCKRFGSGWHTGTKWRCPKQVLPGKQYCEKHSVQVKNRKQRLKVVGAHEQEVVIVQNQSGEESPIQTGSTVLIGYSQIEENRGVSVENSADAK